MTCRENKPPATIASQSHRPVDSALMEVCGALMAPQKIEYPGLIRGEGNTNPKPRQEYNQASRWAEGGGLRRCRPITLPPGLNFPFFAQFMPHAISRQIYVASSAQVPQLQAKPFSFINAPPIGGSCTLLLEGVLFATRFEQGRRGSAWDICA